MALAVEQVAHGVEDTAAILAAPTRRRSLSARLAGKLWAYLPTTVAVGACGALWALLTSTGVVKPYVLPGPAAVWSAFFVNFPTLVQEARITLLEALAGFAIGNAVAVSAAVAFVYSPLLERAWYPIALVSRGVPMVAIVPILVLWLGTGLAPKIAIAALAVVIPTLVNTVRGLRSSDEEVEEVLHTLDASELQRLVKVRLPSSMPYLFASLRVATCTAFIAATIAEWVSSNAGLGYLIETYGYEFEIPALWAAVVSAALLCLGVYAVVSALEHRLTHWQRAVERQG